MAKGFVLDPTALREDDITSNGPDAGPLTGKTVGIRTDEMWRSWDWISELWADEFRKAGAKVEFWRSSHRTGAPGEAAAKSLAEFFTRVDCTVVGLGNCGSCTGWTIHDALASAATGLPTIAIVTDNFKGLGRNLARRGGRSGLRIHVLPYPLNEGMKEDVEPIGREHFPQVVAAMGAQLGAARVAAE